MKISEEESSCLLGVLRECRAVDCSWRRGEERAGAGQGRTRQERSMPLDWSYTRTHHRLHKWWTTAPHFTPLSVESAWRGVARARC